MGELSFQVFFLILFLILLITQLNPLNPKPQGSGFIMGIINFMPTSYAVDNFKKATNAPVIDPLPDSPAILITNNLDPILDASSQQIYRLFLEKKQNNVYCYMRKLRPNQELWISAA